MNFRFVLCSSKNSSWFNAPRLEAHRRIKPDCRVISGGHRQGQHRHPGARSALVDECLDQSKSGTTVAVGGCDIQADDRRLVAGFDFGGVLERDGAHEEAVIEGTERSAQPVRVLNPSLPPGQWFTRALLGRRSESIRSQRVALKHQRPISGGIFFGQGTDQHGSNVVEAFVHHDLSGNAAR